MVLRLAGRETDPAIPHDHAGDPVPGRGLHALVPGGLAVVMGVDVHEARTDQLAAGVELLAAHAGHLADGDDAAVLDPDIGLAARRPGAVHQMPAAHDQIIGVVHGCVSLSLFRCIWRARRGWRQAAGRRQGRSLPLAGAPQPQFRLTPACSRTTPVRWGIRHCSLGGACFRGRGWRSSDQRRALSLAVVSPGSDQFDVAQRDMPPIADILSVAGGGLVEVRVSLIIRSSRHSPG